MEILNARITGTKLGFEDHGIFTCMLTLEMDNYTQGFGGYWLSYHTEMLEQILKVVGVEDWEDLPGKLIRVKKDGRLNSPILSIGNIVKNSWYTPSDYTKEEDK